MVYRGHCNREDDKHLSYEDSFNPHLQTLKPSVTHQPVENTTIHYWGGFGAIRLCAFVVYWVLLLL